MMATAHPTQSGPVPGWLQALRTPPLWAGFLFGFAEATLFFVVPDVIITWAALFSPRQAIRQLAAVLCGSLVGGIVMYSLARLHPELMRSAVDAVPFIPSVMFDTVQSGFDAHGAWSMCMGPLSGIPYKVYAVLAPVHVPLLLFVLISIPARIERLALSLAIFVAAGWAFRRFQPGRMVPPVLAFITYWTVVYVSYWTRF